MISYRLAIKEDVDIYFNWANEKEVRNNSINTSEILYNDHVKWFEGKMGNPDTIMLIFREDDKNIGQLQIVKDEKEAVISYSVDKLHRGKGYGTALLKVGFNYYLLNKLSVPLTGLVKPNNLASIKAFVSAGFEQMEQKVNINGELYVKFSKNG